MHNGWQIVDGKCWIISYGNEFYTHHDYLYSISNKNNSASAGIRNPHQRTNISNTAQIIRFKDRPKS